MKYTIIKDFITPEDIGKVRDSYRVGDIIKARTYKSRNPNTLSHNTCAERKAVIVTKYRQFALVRLGSGVIDSVLWVDLIGHKKAKKERAKNVVQNIKRGMESH